MEKILCAAIWYNDGKYYIHQPKNIQEGYVMCGRRHHNIINLRYLLTGESTREDTSVQGFLTDTDRFVDRTEAYTIHRQLHPNDFQTTVRELYSEDLY